MPFTPREGEAAQTPAQTQIQSKHTYGTKPEGSTPVPTDGIRTENLDTFVIPQITLKDALEAVPYFDGRATHFRDFANGCRDAKDMISPRMEASLVKLIKNRVKGLAKDKICGTHFLTISELVDYLENFFAPRHSVSNLQGRLNKALQAPNEDVITYGARINRLKTEIIEAYNKLYPGSTAYSQDTEREAIKCFSIGLSKGIHINPLQYKTLDEAIRGAIEAEADKIRYDEVHRSFPLERSITKWSRFQNNEPRSVPTYPQRNVNNIQLNSTPPACNHCKKPGHTESRCWAKHGKPLDFERAAQMECNYCKNRGHTIDVCRKKKFADEMRKHQGNGNNLSQDSATREAKANITRINHIRTTASDATHEYIQ